MVSRVRTPDCASTQRFSDSRTQLVTAARDGIARLSWRRRGVYRATPGAGETTSDLTVVGSNPIRRTSGGSSVEEPQECLVTVCRRLVRRTESDTQMSNWITIDGAEGEGGGQLLRTALTLSLVTGRPFRIESIRAGRRKPGLLRQHLTAVRAAAEVGRARVSGAEVGSRSLTFEPSEIRAGDYELAVGTAGSATLVFQALLPALLCARQPSRLTIDGGTHNPYAPPFDFVAKAFLPVLALMGASVDVRQERYGFYPAGGGRITFGIEPCPALAPLTLLDRGSTRVHARALVASLPESIGKREISVVRGRLGLDRSLCRVETVDTSAGPGNVLSIVAVGESVTEVVTGFGIKGVSAEQVASDACDEAGRYLRSDVPVGMHLADQLLVPMALAGGGSFRTLPPTAHTVTNAGVVQRFLNVSIAIDTESRDVSRITVCSR
jgi:RNA 3'-terminal phosphate cyclase (ATP)